MSDLAALKERVDATINMADERHYFGASIAYQKALEAEIERLTRELNQEAVRSEMRATERDRAERERDEARAQANEGGR